MLFCVFIVMVFVSCALECGNVQEKNNTTSIFFNKFTIQNYKKEIKEDVLFAVYVNLWVTFLPFCSFVNCCSAASIRRCIIKPCFSL